MTVSSAVTETAAQLVTAADSHPLVARVSEYAHAVLSPNALDTDRRGIKTDLIADLAELQLLNHLAPAEFGGAAIGRNEDRRIHELLAGACLNTWLVWAQHAPMVGRLAEAHATGAELPQLGYEILRGRVLVGAAVSDVRRFPDHFIAATRGPDGWTFSGTVSWLSGWSLSTVLTVAAVEESTRTVVTALVPITDALVPTGLELSAVAGSRTERIHLRDLFVPDEFVIDIVPLHRYRTKDLGTASDARAHHFGLAERVLTELDEAGPSARRVADVWRPRIAQLRSDAYALTDAAKTAADDRYLIDERLRTKVTVGDALTTLTRALLIARAGRGIVSDDTAQLHARSALFILVQGQTSEVREAQLSRLAR